MGQLTHDIELLKKRENNDDDEKDDDFYRRVLPENLLDIMSRLFDIGSYVAKPTTVAVASKKRIDHDDEYDNEFDPLHVKELELYIDQMTNEMPELTNFILPTGNVL